MSTSATATALINCPYIIRFRSNFIFFKHIGFVWFWCIYKLELLVLILPVTFLVPLPWFLPLGAHSSPMTLLREDRICSNTNHALSGVLCWMSSVCYRRALSGLSQKNLFLDMPAFLSASFFACSSA